MTELEEKVLLNALADGVVLVEGEAIGHPRYIVTDDSFEPLIRNPVPDVRRQLQRVRCVGAEEIADDPSGFFGHSDDSMVAVEILEEKCLQLVLLLFYGRCK